MAPPPPSIVATPSVAPPPPSADATTPVAPTPPPFVATPPAVPALAPNVAMFPVVSAASAPTRPPVTNTPLEPSSSTHAPRPTPRGFILHKLLAPASQRLSGVGSTSSDSSGKKMREVAFPICTVHLQVRVLKFHFSVSSEIVHLVMM
ncbi:proline-rich receptor-like protein kinase PERK2 [Phalaenopsis equestris]|uniref:proline-rich receptor-like protein kinase PERK2 n=1 Tax=Phalaenopsis equestris TaxID=78828 RepID=UPI0009E43FB3|nr:proline-rich receptor-like protein kinase PERK2 [Phalaenopsis equestris]